jgi:hypothetical protein
VTGVQVFTVMRDHTGVNGVSGGKLCHCGESFLNPLEHTFHVADAIAAAVRADARERRNRRNAAVAVVPVGCRLLLATELGLDQLGLRVVVPVQGIGDVTGLLLRADDGDDPVPGFLELELLPPGDAPSRSYLVRGDARVEVWAR